jgi:hypothetical protein
MSNYQFPCVSPTGLTTAQKREAIKQLRESIKGDAFQKRIEKQTIANDKAEAKAAKVSIAIQKAKARLQKLLDMEVGAVGSKARKFAKRPSKSIRINGTSDMVGDCQ